MKNLYFQNIKLTNLYRILWFFFDIYFGLVVIFILSEKRLTYIQSDLLYLIRSSPNEILRLWSVIYLFVIKNQCDSDKGQIFLKKVKSRLRSWLVMSTTACVSCRMILGLSEQVCWDQSLWSPQHQTILLKTWHSGFMLFFSKITRKSLNFLVYIFCNVAVSNFKNKSWKVNISKLLRLLYKN